MRGQLGDMSPEDALIAHVAQLRQTISDDVTTLYDAPGAARFHDRRHTVLRWYDRHYRPALANLIAGLSREALAARLAETEVRLERGWAMPSSPAVDDLFVRLTREVEVLADALAGSDDARRQHVARISLIGARYA